MNKLKNTVCWLTAMLFLFICAGCVDEGKATAQCEEKCAEDEKRCLALCEDIPLTNEKRDCEVACTTRQTRCSMNC